MSKVFRNALKLNITDALEGKMDDLSKKISEIQQTKNRLKIGDEIELAPGVKVKYAGSNPFEGGDVSFTSLDGNNTINLSDIISDFAIKFDATPNGLVKIEGVDVKALTSVYEQKGIPKDQASVIAVDEVSRVDNSQMMNSSKVTAKVDASVSPATVDSVKPAEVTSVITEKKGDVEIKIDTSSLNRTTATAFLESNLILDVARVGRKATGGTPVIPKLERALESKSLLDAGEKLTKGAEASKASSKVKKWFKRLGVFIGAVSVLFVGAALEDIIALATETTLAAAAEEHQKDQNGCWLIDSIALTETKVKLLTCGTFDVSTAMETCASQTYTPANAATITKCPATTFNPCAKSSRSRATDQSVPLVPDVCDMYLYKGTAPTAVTGVTTKNACLNTDGTPLKDTEACSVFCSTANFNLPSHQVLVCRSLTYPEAYAHLLATIGVDPSKVFPPKGETNPTETSGAPQLTAVSKPLVITAAVLGGVFLILLAIYFVW
jgi:hypothetical protein